MSRFDLSVEEWKIIQPVPRGVRFAWPAPAGMFMTDGSWTPSSIGGNAPLAMVMDKAYGCARIRRAVTDEGALSLPPPQNRTPSNLFRTTKISIRCETSLTVFAAG